MDLGTILIALPIFFLAYQAVGLYLEIRAQKQWTPLAEEKNEDLSEKSLQELTRFSSKLSFNKTLLKYEKLNSRLELLLLRSGNPFGWKAENLLFIKEVSMAFVLLVLLRSGTTSPLAYLLGLAIGFLSPDYYMQAKISERQSVIQRQLPGLVDLLALTLEGGLDFMAAIERIMEKMKKSPLRDELGGLLQESRLGTPRPEALRRMAFRVNLPDIQSLVSIIIQSEELGTSLASVLRGYAEDMRNRRLLLAEEMSGKAPVKLLIPMMVFFFPIVFVIIFGPIALNFFGSK